MTMIAATTLYDSPTTIDSTAFAFTAKGESKGEWKIDWNKTKSPALLLLPHKTGSPRWPPSFIYSFDRLLVQRSH